MHEQYSIKREQRKSTSFFFTDYDGFPPDVFTKIDAEVQRLVQHARYEAAAGVCLEWIPRLVLGRLCATHGQFRVRTALVYFHRYQRFSLGFAVVALFLSWNALMYAVLSR